jgi:NADH-quinone oxidoreductase subunit E
MTKSPTPHVTQKAKFTLGNDIVTKIKELANHYPQKNSAVIPALHSIQDKFGWVPPDTVKELAEILDTTPNKIYSVLTFYTMFSTQPVGKFHIQICRNISCSLLGAKSIYDYITESYGIKPGQTTPDGKFTLSLVECLGACGTAPVMMINDQYYENLTVQKVEKILKSL